LKHIAGEVFGIIQGKFNIGLQKYANSNPTISEKEYGHYTPIIDKVKKELGLKYDLESYFTFSRKRYLWTILNYDSKPQDMPVADLTQMRRILEMSLEP
jgi:hypothetical protein